MRTGWQIQNTFAPAWNKGKGGPKALKLELDFTSKTSVEFDLLQEVENNQIDFVQSMFIDNSGNGSSLTIAWDVTQQTIVIPAGAQGIFPVITPKQNPRAVASSAGGVLIRCLLLNVPLGFSVWGGSISVSPGIVTGEMTDASGTIAAGGVSQQLVAANAARKRLYVTNPSAATESLYINFGAAAVANQTSIEIFPGNAFDTGAGPLSTQVVNIIAATTGHVFGAKEIA